MLQGQFLELGIVKRGMPKKEKRRLHIKTGVKF
jgi:hypothetical protein